MVLLYQLRDVLLPFVAGAALAYALDPVADRLERLGIGRLTATLIILATFLLGLILALILVVPLAANQVAALVASLPAMIAKLQAIIAERAGPLIDRAGHGHGGAEHAQPRQPLGRRWPGSSIPRSLAVVGQPGGGRDHLAAGGDARGGVLPPRRLGPDDRDPRPLGAAAPPPTARMLARDIDGAITAFIRGQSLVCLILGTFYALGLWLVGLNFGVLIGLMAASSPSSRMSARSPASCSPPAWRWCSSGPTGSRWC